MNKLDVFAHKQVIKGFCDSPEKGVWEQQALGTDWNLVFSPEFLQTCKYVMADEIAGARKWRADGKSIQIRTLWSEGCGFSREWKEFIGDELWTTHNGTPIEYRLTPTFSVGSWLRCRDIEGKVFQATEDDVKYPETTLGKAEIWEPRKSDTVVVWDKAKGGTTYVTKYIVSVSVTSGVLVVWVSNLRAVNTFDNVIPYVGQEFKDMN